MANQPPPTERLSPKSTQNQFANAPAEPAYTLPSAVVLDIDSPSAPPGYEILGVLGRGGMGVVYHARQTKLNRVVALKMILAGGHAAENDRARFLAEAEAIAALNHPGIVQVYEYGVDTGQPYFALEYCPGGSLAKRLNGTPLPPREAASLAQTLADAIHAAHEKGIVHRDLNPANVLFTRAADEAEVTISDNPVAIVKITDFGLAKRVENGADLTRSGAIMGTPSYMAPEQAVGDGKRIGPATDVYALGAILYEMLTGRPPFKAENQFDTILQVVNEDPVGIRALQRKTPIDLETICHRCLHKDPSRRYASAQALARDLGRWLSGESIQARPATRIEKAIKWAKRRPALAGMCLTILALLAVVIGSVIVYQRQQLAQQLAREQGERRTRATLTVDAIKTAGFSSVPLIVRALAPLRSDADPLLRERHAAAKPGSTDRLRFGLALLPSEPALADEILGAVPNANAEELLVIRESLRGHSDRVTALWPRLGSAQPPEQLRLLALLAGYLPADERWQPFADGLVDQLVKLNPLELAAWSPAFEPIHESLTPPLVERYRKTQAKLISGQLEVQDLVSVASQFDMTATLLARYAADQPDALAEVLQLADARHYSQFFDLAKARSEIVSVRLQGALDRTLPANAKDGAKEDLAKRQANAAAALLGMSHPEKLWPLLTFRPDPRTRSYLIHRLGLFGVDPLALIQRFAHERDVSARSALLLALGEFDPAKVPADERDKFARHLLDEFRTHPDPGLHGAIDWLLRQRWGRKAESDRIVVELASPIGPSAGRSEGASANHPTSRQSGSPKWIVNSQGQTFTVIAGPVEFVMGSPPTEVGRVADEMPHTRRIGRSFAIAAKAVTVDEYRRFRPDYGGTEQWAPTGDCPVLGTSWFLAAEYCNWLSKQEGIPESEWCYEPVPYAEVVQAMTASSVGLLGSPLGPLAAAAGLFPGRTDPKYQFGMKLAANYLQRTGYRVPTEAEMEFATRAGTSTSRCFGETEDLLAHYAWFSRNSNERSWPVGSKKPNDLGLFDVHGNAWTWCLEANTEYSKTWIVAGGDDVERSLIIGPETRILRGGSFYYPATLVRSAYRNNNVPTNRNYNIGFRLAKTVAP